MIELTIEEIYTKYKNIESKIPSIFKTYELAGIELSKDILFHYNIRNGEIIRVMSIINYSQKIKFNFSEHIDNKFSFAGLYPHIQKVHNIYPDAISICQIELLNKILETRNNRNAISR